MDTSCYNIVKKQIEVTIIKWEDAVFRYQGIAELCREELNEAGIKVGKIFFDNVYYHVPWMPMSQSEYKTGVQIVWSTFGRSF